MLICAHMYTAAPALPQGCSVRAQLHDTTGRLAVHGFTADRYPKSSMTDHRV